MVLFPLDGSYNAIRAAKYIFRGVSVPEEKKRGNIHLQNPTFQRQPVGFIFLSPCRYCDRHRAFFLFFLHPSNRFLKGGKDFDQCRCAAMPVSREVFNLLSLLR